MRKVSVLLLILVTLAACTATLPYHTTGEVVATFPHDPAAFTQGLVFDGDVLYESTGLHGASSLRQVDLETGEVLQMHALPEQYFAEGIVVWGDEIIQLTWKSSLGFVYDKEGFEIDRTFTYPGEGWGVTTDGKRLIMSDGTSWLRFLDPDTLEQTGRVRVLDKGEPIVRLNELEWVRGEVWANVWQEARIARIDPDSGEVLGWIDFTELAAQEPRGVLNGIAVRDRKIYVTGKEWEHVYQVVAKPER